MKFRKLNSGVYVVRFEKGEELVSVLLNFARAQNVQSAAVQGIGGLEEATLGVYRLSSTKEYEWTEFSGDLELISLLGNITQVDGETVAHLHATVGNEQLDVKGGHLKQATIAGTVELFVTPIAEIITRTHSEEIGLKLLELEN